MDKPWSQFCYMSLVHFMAFAEAATGEGAIAKTVAQVAEDEFFDAIEIAWIADAGERTRVRQVLEASQLQAGFCAHPTILSQRLSLNDLNRSRRTHAIQKMKELIDQASELGAKRFVFLSGPDPGQDLRSAALDTLIDSVFEMCAHAQPLGIGLTLETFDRSVDKRSLIGPVHDAAHVAQAVREKYPSFGLLYDLSHMPLLDETPADLAVIADYLVQAHVGNCVKEPGHSCHGDRHPYFGVRGGVSGVTELAQFIRGLFAARYLRSGREPLPWVGFEVKPQGPGETPELVIANCRRTWRQAWAMA
jgi:sugar phosphate isomerase/epimerase